MSDQAPQTVTLESLKASIDALATSHGDATKRHTISLWAVAALVLVAVLATGFGVYFYMTGTVSPKLQQVSDLNATIQKTAAENDSKIQVLMESLAAQSPALRTTVNSKLKALGFQEVPK